MRFVSPETVRIDLKPTEHPRDDGTVEVEKHWIEIKQELTAGEDDRYRSAGLRRMSQRADDRQNEIDIDWVAMKQARVRAYLVAWSARDAKGRSVPVSQSAIESLSKPDFDEIDKAIEQHIADRDDAKNVQSIEPTSTPASA